MTNQSQRFSTAYVGPNLCPIPFLYPKFHLNFTQINFDWDLGLKQIYMYLNKYSN